MRLTIDLARQKDGRWLAEVRELPGVCVLGNDRLDAFRRAEAMALRALAAHLDQGKAIGGAPAELALSFALA
jgi:predicted RNase H-like HicB family nuclease